MQLIVAKILIDQGFTISSLYGFLGIYEIPWIFSQLITDKLSFDGDSNGKYFTVHIPA